MKKKTLLSPLAAAAMALWLGMADAKTELFFTSPTVTRADGTEFQKGSLKEMDAESKGDGVPVSWAAYPSGTRSTGRAISFMAKSATPRCGSA